MASVIPKIDGNDTVIGQTTITEAKKNGWPRRISRVFIFDTNGHILLQRRGSGVVSYPNLLDQAAGGHVDFGETYQEAAYRELKEELGLSDVQLVEIKTSYRNRDCFEGIYKGIIAKETILHIDSTEVGSMVWMPIDEFDTCITSQSAEFVPVLDVVWRDFKVQLLT